MRPGRAGFSLVELIVAITASALLGAGVIGVLVRQQKFFRAATEMLGVRAQVRDGIDILVSDIRSAAVASFGIPLMTDSAIELYSVTGTSVICRTPVGAVVYLPPSLLASGNTLTSFVAQPDDGDLAMLYATDSANGDGRWDVFRIAAFTGQSVSSACPPAEGFTSPGDLSASGSAFQLTLGETPSGDVRKGSPVRFVRRARYSLYRSGDGKWYLGYRRCDPGGVGGCDAVQPVSGPYMPYAGGAGAPSGIGFRYYDAQGLELSGGSSGNSVARIDITVRSESTGALRLAGDAVTRYRDSSVVSVSPRNRLR
ncbi:MAG: prepilin-type N-terminal cleavage/methylation domain-containing protein [Gemmatimonadaceae bacterium]|nr:prepilin-type N-terminal cleavage/methylation domain-containing protein [Gemmatimonadaceae bacterium]MDQ3243163.1 prepilin-type N-terminal cleavage/methylation domain-containing protein [Gemmatimonadota bacterium]